MFKFHGHKIKKYVTKIDVIHINLTDESCSCYKAIQGLSDSEFQEVNVKNSKSKYNWKSKFLIQGRRITLLRINSGKEVHLNIEQPTRQLQDILLSLFLKHKAKYILNYVELAFDFYTETKDEARILQNSMIKTLIHKNNRHECEIKEYEDGSRIFYSAKLKKDEPLPSKLTKLYIRPFASQKTDKGVIPYPFVRMEESLRQRQISKFEWTVPLTSNQIRDILTYKLIGFCEFKHKEFRKYILKDKQKYLQKEIETKSGRTIRDFCNVLMDQDMYVIIQFFKSVGLPYSRFLDYDALQDENLLLGRALFELHDYDVVPPQRVKIIKRRKSIIG